MVKKRVARELRDRLDQLGRDLVRAASITEAEADDAVSSPWIFARLRARIAAERRQREAGERWSILVAVIRHAVPTMGLVAAIAVGLFLNSGVGTPEPVTRFNDQALFATNDAGVQWVVFADRRSLSSDEVFETIINGDREASK